jgi:hypothetical protein
MNLELTDEQAAALLKELNDIIDGDRYFMSPRIGTLKEISAKRRPEPVRDPLPPPPKQYAPARASGAKRRRGGASGPSLSVALRAGEDEDDGEQRAGRRQAPKNLRHSRPSSTIAKS